MEANEVQREGSTLSHTPNRLQVLLIIVLVLGQGRVWVVPASVSGQERRPVVCASHWPGAAHVCDNGEGMILKQGLRRSKRVQVMFILMMPFGVISFWPHVISWHNLF